MRVEVDARRRQRLRQRVLAQPFEGDAMRKVRALVRGVMHRRMIGGISLCARYSLPRKFESCIDGGAPHMRTYHKHMVLSMMSSRPRVSLQPPCGHAEFARKVLIFHELVPDLDKMSLVCP